MKIIYQLVLLALSFLIIHPNANDAFATTKKEGSCVTEKCHNDMGVAKYVHGPITAGACIFCHKQAGGHQFQPIEDVGGVCYQCHEKHYAGKSVHAPVKNGNCTSCHDAHQSAFKFLLRGDVSNLCFNCHDATLFKRKFVHGPASLGGCSICHDPHYSDFPYLLSSEGNDVCFLCHANQQAEFEKKQYIHAPVKDRCVTCHNPHSSDYKYGFAKEGRQDLCFSCHEKKKKQIDDATVKHKGLEAERKCLTCHDPHASDYTKQLTVQPLELCMQCHDREYTTSTGKIANIKTLLSSSSNHHGPIRQNDCSACHDSHGSNNFMILREYFPNLFYSAYNPNNYKLCFMCHVNTLAETERTETLTNFRNGDQNLHFLHVNKRKGRTCRACHDAHATNNPLHIRDAVPFGSWDLPINFKLTPNGGECSPGCHQPFRYDRTKAVPTR